MTQPKTIIFDLGGVLFKYYKPEVFQLIEKGGKVFTAVPEGIEILDKIIAKGYTVYGYTNWKAIALKKLKEEFPKVCNKFKAITSAHEIGYRKPEHTGYKKLLDQFNLEASDCIFIDDQEENVVAAKEVGIEAIFCNSHDNVKTELKKLNILD